LFIASAGALPSAQQQVDFLVAADKRVQRRSSQRLKPALDGTLCQNLPSADQLAAGGFDCAELAAVEQMTNKASCRWIDRHRVRLRRNLQPRRQVLGVAGNFVAMILGSTDGVADDDHPRRDPDPALDRWIWPAVQRSDRRTQFEPCPHRRVGIVLVRHRITEDDQHGVAEIPCDGPAVAFGRL
jgi:hypothetical protein